MTAARDSRFRARGPLVLGFATLAVLFAGLFGWGAFGSISGAVIATGRVEVESRDQVVEHVDGGTVEAILVRDGDRVEAGDVLIRLDEGRLRAQEALFLVELAELVARRNRFEAEYRGLDAIVWNKELASLSQVVPAVEGILEGQRGLFEARRTARTGEEALLREQIGQIEQTIEGIATAATYKAEETALLERELKIQRGLFEKGLTQLHRLLALERESIRLKGLANEIEVGIATARGKIAELETAILQIGVRLVEEAESMTQELKARENLVREKLGAVRDRMKAMAVRAPVSGTVHGLAVSTLGEVVSPGESVAYVVPQADGLIVRARLDPMHVDEVYPDQQAVLRFSALPMRTTPEFEGRVRHISADAMHDRESGLDWYEVEIGMGEALVSEPDFDLVSWVRGVIGIAAHDDGASAVALPDLTPGMPVEVYIQTGERSPLSYLTEPLTGYLSRAMREE